MSAGITTGVDYLQKQREAGRDLDRKNLEEKLFWDVGAPTARAEIVGLA